MSYENGGGIHQAGGMLRLLQSTVVGNYAANTGGGIANYDAAVRIERSIVAANYADSLGHDVFTDDFGGTFFDDYNLFNNLDASDITTRATDIVGISPELLPLDDYGGPTATMLPDASSPAVDHIPAGDCNDFDGNPLLVDQRGSPRPSGGGCDIGAVERQQ